MNNERKSVLYYPQWMIVFSKIKNTGEENISDFVSGAGYSNVHKIIKELEKNNYLTTEIKGRECIIKLTDKGVRAQEYLLHLRSVTD